MYSPETQSKMAHLRAKASDGSITEDELRQAVKMMREDRFAALQAQANKPPSKRAAKAPVNVASLFDSLDKI
jgi:hypothetical protein